LGEIWKREVSCSERKTILGKTPVVWANRKRFVVRKDVHIKIRARA